MGRVMEVTQQTGPALSSFIPDVPVCKELWERLWEEEGLGDEAPQRQPSRQSRNWRLWQLGG